MPVQRIIDVDPGDEDTIGAADSLRRELKKHVASARLLQAQRNRQSGKPRTRPLAQTVDFSVASNEDEDTVLRDAAADMIEIIASDANGEDWRGVVRIYASVEEGDEDSRGKLLSTVKVELDGSVSMGAAKPTRDSELTGVLSALKDTIKGLGEVAVRIGNTKADEHAAYTQMVVAVAQSVQVNNGVNAEYNYKIHQETQETERIRVEVMSSVAKTRARMDAFETFIEEYKDVAQTWSEWLTREKRAPLEPPKLEEITKIYDSPGMSVDGKPWEEIFDAVRAIVARMISEPNKSLRFKIARTELKPAYDKLSENERKALEMRASMVLGEERAKAIASWLTAPITG